jgi:UDP-glucuronate 4-epimerase
MKILVTGTAGFIGSTLAVKLAERGNQVIGIDNINAYYDVNLKYGRLIRDGIDPQKAQSGETIQSENHSHYQFLKMDLEDRVKLLDLFKNQKFDRVCHLAAQAGVRYSLTNPDSYIQSNIVGFLNILEACRHHPVQHLLYASSSSVYGLNTKYPFSTHDNVDHPVSLYAATKKSDELMAHTYSHLFQIPTTGLRFFTVYGPWGRPDMALFLFTRAILEGRPIEIYNNGAMQRDFTYIDDIVSGVIKTLDRPPQGDPDWDSDNPDPSRSIDPYRIYNIGNNSPVGLLDFVQTLEKTLGKEALKTFLPLQPGDVPKTWADVSDLVKDLHYKPDTSIQKGIEQFVSWYREFYQHSGA